MSKHFKPCPRVSARQAYRGPLRLVSTLKGKGGNVVLGQPHLQRGRPRQRIAHQNTGTGKERCPGSGTAGVVPSIQHTFSSSKQVNEPDPVKPASGKGMPDVQPQGEGLHWPCIQLARSCLIQPNCDQFKHPCKLKHESQYGHIEALQYSCEY